MEVPVVIRPHGPGGDLDLLEKSSDHSLDVGVASALVLPANKNRTAATFVNDSDTKIYLRLGQEAALNTGIVLNANGGAFELNKTNLWKGEVHAICSLATKKLCIMEWETRYAY